MNMLEAVYWDVDGTLADTEMFGHRVAFNLAFKEYKIDWIWNKEKYIELLNISGGFNRIKYYADSINYSCSDDLMRSIHRKKQIFYKDILLNGNIPLRNGVKRLIEELNRFNVEQWIVTTSSKVALDSLLNSTLSKHSHYFNGYVSYEDVINHKPDPSAYFKAITQSRASISKSIVIEDSIIGLQSAKSAGLNCLVTISPWLKFDSLCYTEADSVVDNLGENDYPSKVYIGPSIKNGVIDIEYLNKLINLNCK